MLSGSRGIIVQPVAKLQKFVFGQLDKNATVPPRAPSISPAQLAWIESSHGQLRVTIPSKRVRQGARWRLRTLRPAMPVSLGFDGDRERDQSLPRWRTCSSPAFPGLRGSGRDAARRRRMLRRHLLGGAARPRVDPMRPGYRCRPRVGTTPVAGQMARHSHPSSSPSEDRSVPSLSR